MDSLGVVLSCDSYLVVCRTYAFESKINPSGCLTVGRCCLLHLPQLLLFIPLCCRRVYVLLAQDNPPGALVWEERVPGSSGDWYLLAVAHIGKEFK